MARKTLDAVQLALASIDGFASAQEIHARLRETGHSLGLTTVYRCLRSMTGDHRVDFVRRDDGEGAYRFCGTSHHHHHLVCRSCGDTVEVQAEAVESWAQTVGEASNFRDLHHTVELTGICASCSGR